MAGISWMHYPRAEELWQLTCICAGGRCMRGNALSHHGTTIVCWAHRCSILGGILCPKLQLLLCLCSFKRAMATTAHLHHSNPRQ